MKQGKVHLPALNQDPRSINVAASADFAAFCAGLGEASMKIANIKGMNAAFWITTEDRAESGNHFVIDVSESTRSEI